MPETEIIKDEGSKHHHFWLFIFIIFLGILGFILYTSYYNNEFVGGITGKITDNIIKNNKTSKNFKINAELSVPENIKINSIVKKFSVKINDPLDISIGNQNIHLNKDSSLIIDDFDGEFSIKSNKISELKGNTAQIFINGIPIKKKSGSTNIVIEKEFHYNYLELKEVYIKSLSYPTSGDLRINSGKITIKLNNENFNINNFNGNIEINKGLLRLSGFIDDFDLDGYIRSSKNELIK